MVSGTVARSTANSEPHVTLLRQAQDRFRVVRLLSTRAIVIDTVGRVPGHGSDHEVTPGWCTGYLSGCRLGGVPLG